MTTGKTVALTTWTFVGKVMSLLFNMLSRLVIAFLPRNKYLLISWLQSPSAVILEPKKIKSVTSKICRYQESKQASQVVLVVKNLHANAKVLGVGGSMLGWEGPLETYSSILAWRIPWMEEPGRLQSIELHRVRQEWSNLALHTWSNALEESLDEEGISLDI